MTSQRILNRNDIAKRHRASTSTRWHFAFALCWNSNATRSPIANLPNSAQLGGTLYHFPKLHSGPCSSVVGMQPWTDRHTVTRMWPLYISRSLRLTWNVINNNFYILIFGMAKALLKAQCQYRKVKSNGDFSSVTYNEANTNHRRFRSNNAMNFGMTCIAHRHNITITTV